MKKFMDWIQSINGFLFWIFWLVVVFGSYYILNATAKDACVQVLPFTFGVYLLWTRFMWEGPNKIRTSSIKNQFSQTTMSSHNLPDMFQPGKTVTCYVAGVSFENRQEVIGSINVGDRVYLIRDEENKFDTNAIGVFISGSEDRNFKSIGFLPKEIAAKIFKYFDLYTSDEFICKGKVVELTHTTNQLIGVKITFNIPSEDWLTSEQMYKAYSDY